MKTKLYLHFLNASIRICSTRMILIGSMFLLQFITINLHAQTSVITGNVSDASGPLYGVSIRVQGTTSGTVTDSIGNYSIAASENAIIVFSSIGYNTQSINVDKLKIVNVRMTLNKSALEGVVVVGYGTEKKEDFTGAATSIKGDALSQVPSSNLSNVLAGRLSGVYVAQNTGVPGTSSSIQIRSSASWNPSPPLFVIDGVVRDQVSFDALNANDIETITVLKDGASSSIYGARASNGVVLVTTKKGRIGKPTITYNATYLMEKPTTSMMELGKSSKQASLLSAYQSALLNNLWSEANLGYPWFGPDDLNELKRTGGYDYLSYAYVTPSTADNEINVSGGSKNIKYYMGGDIYTENGFLKELTFNKYNLRASIDATITKNLTASIQLSTNYGAQQQINFGGSTDLSAMYGKLAQFFFYVPPYINGNLVNPGWIGNPLGLINQSGYDRTDTRGTDALVTLNYNVPFVQGLSVKVFYSKNDVSNTGKVYQIQPTLYNYKRDGSEQKIFTDTLLSVQQAPYPAVPFLSVSNASQSSYQFNTQLSYVQEFGKHHVDATIVSEQYKENDNNNSLTRQSFPIITTDQFFATSDNNIDSYGNGSESSVGRESYIGRVNYLYNEKYLFSASLRADGSMIFAPGHRWGYFPAVSAGWRVSEEDFFKKRFSDVFNQFKLRASLGYTGNDAVAPWQWQEKFVPAGNAYFGNSLQPVIAYGGVVNKNLTWERSRSTNFGLDMATTFNLIMSLNFWQRNTYDILGTRIVALPTTFGGTLPSVNYGKMNSHGFEMELGYNNKVGDFTYSVNGNLAYATTKVIQEDFAPGGQAVDNPNGKPLGYTSALVSTGIIRTQQQLDALPAGYTINGAKPVLGDLNYKDISGINGKPDGKIDSYDRSVISNYSQGTAPYTAGLNMSIAWKGISISVFLQSTFGYPKIYTDNWGRTFPFDASVTKMWGDMWTSTNPNGKYPKFQAPGEPDSSIPSSFWYSPGGYVRLKNLTLAYDFREKWLKKINAQKISINVTGTNLFFLSQFKWYDPEIGGLNSYPNMQTLNFGLSVTF